jgi:hypothetical protein
MGSSRRFPVVPEHVKEDPFERQLHARRDVHVKLGDLAFRRARCSASGEQRRDLVSVVGADRIVAVRQQTE